MSQLNGLLLALLWLLTGLYAVTGHAQEPGTTRVLTDPNAFVKVMANPNAPESAQTKVVSSFVDRNTTRIIIQSREPLVSGRQVYVPPEYLAITVHEQLSRSNDVYYFAASLPGRHDIPTGTAVSLEKPRPVELPARIRAMIREHFIFSPKRFGEVTARLGDRAMIDRGTLHEVRERDLYVVYDASGSYKGLLEVRGLGDFQSSGVLYNRLFDRDKRVLRTEPGDRVVYVGQRKLFALGVLGGVSTRNRNVLVHKEEHYAAGLLWNVTFPDGWGAEMVFGMFNRSRSVTYPVPQGPTHEEDVDVKYILPLWLKKNFFYPSTVSPFLAAGLSPLYAEHRYRSANFATSAVAEETKKVFTVAPMLGAGVEFFPARFFRPRLEVRYFKGPKLTAAGNTLNTESVFVSAGFLTTW